MTPTWLARPLRLAAIALAGLVPATAATADPITHPSLVPELPAEGYPIISGLPTVHTVNSGCPEPGCEIMREVMGADQVGRTIVAGGNFKSVRLQDGSTIAQQNLTAWNIDTKQIACVGVQPDNEVLAVIPGATPDELYIAGRFTTIARPTGGAITRTRVAKLLLPGCTVDPTFVPPTLSNRIDEVALVGDRLFIGGDFTSLGGQAISTLAELDADTGALVPGFSFAFTYPEVNPGELVTNRVRGLAASPDGNRLVLAGRFFTIDDGHRNIAGPTAVIDISNPADAVLTAHQSGSYAPPIKHLQDASIAPDGSSVGLVYGTSNSSDWVYLTPTTAAVVSPTWSHFMRDSTFGVAVTNQAMYVAGHFCRPDGGPGPTEEMTFKNGLSECTGTSLPGGVWRTKIAALDLDDGTPLTWNPGMDAFRGSLRMTVTRRGLLIGADGQRFGFDGAHPAGVETGALAFLDFGIGVEDHAPPGAVAFATPAAGSVQPAALRMTGSATDDVVVRSFRVSVQAADGRYLQPDGTLAAAQAELHPAADESGAFALDVVLPTGTYTAVAVAVDGAGNLSPTTSSRAFAVDADGPATTIGAPPSTVPSGVAQATSGTVADPSGVVALHVRVRDAGGRYLQPGGAFAAGVAELAATVAPALPAASASWSATIPGLAAGAYRVEVSATDGLGTTSTRTSGFVAEAAPPAIAFASARASGGGLAVAGTVTDNVRVQSVAVTVRNAAGRYLRPDGRFAAARSTLAARLAGVGTARATFALTTRTLPPGTYRIGVDATDADGNAASATVTRAVALRAAVLRAAGRVRATGNEVVGYRFRVTRAVTVLAIGIRDANGNGRLDVGRPVGAAIWRANGGRLAATSVAARARAVRGWSYGTLARPLRLRPGVTYVVGVQHRRGGEPVLRGATARVDPVLRIGASVRTAGKALRRPGQRVLGRAFVPNLRLAP